MRVLRWFYGVLALPLAWGSVQAAPDGAAAMRAKGFARLAVSNEPPWATVDADGSVHGAGPDLVRAVFARMGVRAVRTSVAGYGALIPGLMAGRNDVIDFGMFITPSRCHTVAYSEPDLCDREALIVQRDATLPDSYAAIAADPTMRIGVAPSSSEQHLALEAGVSPERIVPIADGPSGMIMLQTGRIQVLALPVMSGRHLMALWGADSFKIGVAANTPVMCAGAAFAPGRAIDGVRDAYDRALAELKSDGSYAEILKRYGFDPDLQSGRTRGALCRGIVTP